VNWLNIRRRKVPYVGQFHNPDIISSNMFQTGDKFIVLSTAWFKSYGSFTVLTDYQSVSEQSAVIMRNEWAVTGEAGAQESAYRIFTEINRLKFHNLIPRLYRL
jgi:hypothetical protein